MDGEVEAVVQAGPMTTWYVRAGQGLPVLLLMRQGPRTTSGAPLFRRLAAEFRVVAPVCPTGEWVDSGPGDAATWLRGLMDGLGLVEARVVVDESLAPALAPFLESDRDRVRGVLVTPPGGWSDVEARIRGL